MLIEREDREPDRCPYCGQPATPTGALHRGADVWICDACAIRYGIILMGDDEEVEQGGRA